MQPRGCHKDAHPPPFFYYHIHSLMFGGYPPTAIGYPPTAIGYPPTAIGYPPAAIIGRIGHSEFFFFFSLRHPLMQPDEYIVVHLQLSVAYPTEHKN